MGFEYTVQEKKLLVGVGVPTPQLNTGLQVLVVTCADDRPADNNAKTKMIIVDRKNRFIIKLF